MPPERLWALLTDTPAYQGWWPWLRSFEPVRLETGARAQCSIGPPLPYLLRVDIAVLTVIAEELVTAEVSGDLRGPAQLEIAATPLGSTARLAWEVEVCRPALRNAAIVARPVLQWGHDWVVKNGVEQFRRAAVESAVRP